jgi:hypothetical protein
MTLFFRRFLPIFLISLITFSTAKAASSLKITFNNQANNPAIKHVYIVLKGNVNNKPCFIKINPLHSPDDPAISQCMPITAATKPADFAFDAVNTTTFRMAPLSSGRMYVSINKPLIMHINPDLSIAEPSVYDSNPVSNPDYKTMFDKIELTYNPDGATFINPTAVDFLSLPLSIAQDDKLYGLTTDRQTAFTQIENTFGEEISTTEYRKLIIRDGNIILRILAPGRDSASFNDKYMDDYINWLFDEYYFNALHTLTLQLVESGAVILGEPNILTPEEGQFTGFVKTLSNGEKGFVFTNSLGDTITIPRSGFTSNGLFMAAMDNITVTLGDATKARIAAIISGIKPPRPDAKAAENALRANYHAVAVKYIVSAWAVGLLPVPNGDAINEDYIRGKIGTDVKTIYTERAPLRDDLLNRGPWYQLYGKAIHLLTPHLYAFPYDDVLGLDGTNGANDSFPVTITLNSMAGSAVPPANANN